MTTRKRLAPPAATDAYEPLSPVEKLEDEASYAALATGDALRAVEVGAVVILGLLVVPPLAILTVLVVLPLLVTALVIGVIAAVLSAPYLLVHHRRSPDGRHASLLGHRLRHAARALSDVLPHRIVADARKLHHRR